MLSCRTGTAFVASCLLVMTLGSGAAEARVKPRIAVSPRTVVAGNPLTVRVSGTRHRRCTITVRPALARAAAMFTRRTRAARVTVAVPASAPAGAAVARVTCGSRSAKFTFAVLAPAPAPHADPPPAAAPVPVSEQLALTDSLPEGEG